MSKLVESDVVERIASVKLRPARKRDVVRRWIVISFACSFSDVGLGGVEEQIGELQPPVLVDDLRWFRFDNVVRKAVTLFDVKDGVSTKHCASTRTSVTVVFRIKVRFMNLFDEVDCEASLTLPHVTTDFR